jgi:GNAT superfamily N-acetyltransferase
MIRLARSTKDLDACLHMQVVCLEHDEPLDPHTDGTWWIAHDEHGYTGFASIRPSMRWYDTAYLSRAGVLPHARGQGIQRDLIKVRLAYAKRNGYTWATSDTFDNIPSANNLIACGFRLVRPTEPWGLPESLHWIKKL